MRIDSLIIKLRIHSLSKKTEYGWLVNEKERIDGLTIIKIRINIADNEK